MASITIKVKPYKSRTRKVLIEMDANKFERLAANLGFFNPEFVISLDQAESDIKTKRINKIKSLKDLRTKKFK